MIEIRRAKPEDKARLKDISSRIWDGDDYIPYVFDKWVVEEGGEFSVITVDGLVAGCAKITALANDVLWLEGIRVDTEYRGLGLGKKLAAYQLERAAEIGYRRLELSSFIENHESLAIIEKQGFEQVAAFKFMICEHIDEKMIEATKAREERPVLVGEAFDRDLLLERLRSNERGGYLNLDWTFLLSDEAFLEEMVSRELIYRYKDTVFAFGDWNQKDDGLTIYFIYGPDYEEVIVYILEYALKNQHSSVMIMEEGLEGAKEVLLGHNFIEIAQDRVDAFVFRHKTSR